LLHKLETLNAKKINGRPSDSNIPSKTKKALVNQLYKMYPSPLDLVNQRYITIVDILKRFYFSEVSSNMAVLRDNRSFKEHTLAHTRIIPVRVWSKSSQPFQRRCSIKIVDRR